MQSDPRQYLEKFGLTAFRPGQQEVIETVLAGQDCLCVMPTGGGKSLCYQLPALAFDGLTLVVSPLIALMKDQVDQLQTLGLPVSYINSTLTMAEQTERLDRMAAGDYKLLYVVPERFRSPRFLEAVQAVGLRLLAIDEAHCISEWGHDFRPDYARLGHFRRKLGRPTTIALTATATDAVRRDIVEQLDLVHPRTFITGFARPNLFYEVATPRLERQKPETLLAFLAQTPGSGIIYASTRKRTEEVAAIVAGESGRRTVAYHAGLLPDARHAAQEAFMSGKAEIVVATTAFGMGIDKRDVRFVVHYNLPGTLEGYYQEAGRAGRDGRPSRCLLIYHASDRAIQEFFIESAYPSREMVAAVYAFLRGIEADPIQLTQQEVKETLGLPIGTEGIGTCEQLLESAGVLERLIASQNLAAVRIDSDLPTLVDLVPRQAKTQRQVLRAVERLVGTRRNEMVSFQLRDLARAAELDPDSLAYALRELSNLSVFTYVPPFRGRALRMVRRDLEFDDLEIDFAALAERKQAEFEKLERVIRFALSHHCRQQEIVTYFGERDAPLCGHCDNCHAAGVRDGESAPMRAAGAPRELPASDDAVDPTLRDTVRIALSGVARVQRRVACGKNVVAQMLCGSASAKLQKLGLHKLSTFGMLGRLTQADVCVLLEALVAVGYLEQVEINSFRPVLQVTPSGLGVMKGTEPLRARLPLPPDVLARIGGNPAATPSAREPVSLPKADASQTAAPGILEALKQWRRGEAEGSGVPPHYVMSNATLEELSRSRPRTRDALLEVHGIGPKKLERYGQALLTILQHGDEPVEPRDRQPEIVPPVRREPPLPPPSKGRAVAPDPIDGWFEDGEPDAAPSDATLVPRGESLTNITTQAATSKNAVEPCLRPSYYWTWRLFEGGFTWPECAAIRRLRREEIVDHLLQAVEDGYRVRAAWCLAPELLARLAELVPVGEYPSVRTVLGSLPAGTSYEEVTLFLKAREG